MKSKYAIPIGILVILAMVIAACSSPSSNNNNAPTTAATQAPLPTSAAQSTESGMATTAAPAATTAAPASTTAPAATTAAPAAAATTAAPAATSAPGAVGTSLPQTGGCPLQVEQGANITFSGWGDQSEQTIYRDSIARFQKACPGVTVNYTPIPDKFQDKMKAQMAGGTAPDVFYVDAQLMSAFAPSGQLMALDDLISQANVNTSGIIPQLLKEFQYNGKTYGIPKDWGTLGLIYLPSAFQQAGIPEPTDNWTWDDVHTAAQKIAAAGKMAGFCQAPDEARFGAILFSYGGSYTSPDFKTATINSPEAIQAASFEQTMVKDGSLKTPTDLGASWCGEAIGKQLVAMTAEGGWMVNFMKQTYPNVEYKAVQIPKGPKTRADIIFTNALGVNAATKYPKASAALVFYITGEANQVQIQSTGFAYSTYSNQLSQISNPIDQAISKGGQLPDSKLDYWGLNTGNVDSAISKALERVFLGQQNVQDSFSQAQQDVQNALK